MLFSKVSNTTLLINSDFLIQPLGCFPDFTVFMIFLNSWCQVPSLLKSTFKFHILTPTGHCWTLLDSATRTFLILLSSCTKSISVWIKNTSVKSERHAFFFKFLLFYFAIEENQSRFSLNCNMILALKKGKFCWFMLQTLPGPGPGYK